MDVADFRSDTVTRPSPAMYRAIAEAELGDDTLGDDPTVAALEREAARILGKERALFLPSGTMANQVALRVHCRPGEEAIVDEGAHLLNFEAGSAALAGIQMRPVATETGLYTRAQLAARLRKGDVHTPRTALVCFENTHNFAGGVAFDDAELAELAALAHEAGAATHLDGARIFNAQIATSVPAARLAAHADSVMFCLSKGLGCPMGSMLCGSAAFIERARLERQRLGGGLRQAGIVAACGLVALREGIERLAEDHRRTADLAQRLAAMSTIDLLRREGARHTNMIYLAVNARSRCSAPALVEGCRARGVLLLNADERMMRMVCHKDVNDSHVERAARAIAELTGAG
jgi:threonine aldolase